MLWALIRKNPTRLRFKEPLMISVTVPELGDASDVEVIELCVKPGDRVAVDDPLIVIESDKASLEVPAPQAGVVRALSVAIGDLCQEGDLIAELEAEDAALEEAPAAAVEKESAAAVEKESAAAVVLLKKKLRRRKPRRLRRR